MVAAGFADTEIVIPDGGGMSADIATGFSTNAAYKEAVYAIGQHCVSLKPRPTPERPPPDNTIAVG